MPQAILGEFEADVLPLVDGTDGLRYHASIPLYANEKKLGVLNVASPDWRELSADDLRLLQSMRGGN